MQAKNKLSGLYKKIWLILSLKQRKSVLIVFIIMIIGTLLETLSVGVLVPVLGTIMNDDTSLYNKYLNFFPFLYSKESIQIFFISLLIGVYIIKGLFLSFQAWFQTRFSFGLTADISNRLFCGYLNQGYHYHLVRNSADLIRNITSEVGTFSSVLQAGIIVMSELSIVASIVILLFIINPFGAIISFLVLSLLATIFSITAKKYNRMWGSQRHHHDSIKLSIILQAFDGIKEIKHYCRENFFSSLYVEHNNKVVKPTENQYTLQLIPRIFFEVIAVVLCLSYVLVQVLFYKNVHAVVPQIGVLVAACFRLMPSFNRIVSSMQTFRFAETVINNLSSEFEKLKLHLDNQLDFEISRVKLDFNKEIKIYQLSFTYFNGKEVFKDVSLSITHNQFVGFTGESGSGKSTMIDLILGLLKPSFGTIEVDGVNISRNPTAWRKIVGYVPQTFYIFNDSIRNNISFSTDENIDDISLDRAIECAQLKTYIAKLPNGIETHVGEKGVELSGGQRQRLAIARALYFNPKILVLDEPTSSLDSETENEIMNALNELRQKIDITIILVTHNKNNLKYCDKIFEVSNGIISDNQISTTIVA